MGFRLRTPSPTTVVACIALFLALGGGGYIALAHGGAGAAKKKVKVGPPGPQGPQGAQGPQGGQGIQGDTGQSGVSTLEGISCTTTGNQFGGSVYSGTTHVLDWQSGARPNIVCRAPGTAVCGDGIIEGSEACDDGNQVNEGTPGRCNSTCTAVT